MWGKESYAAVLLTALRLLTHLLLFSPRRPFECSCCTMSGKCLLRPSRGEIVRTEQQWCGVVLSVTSNKESIMVLSIVPNTTYTKKFHWCNQIEANLAKAWVVVCSQTLSFLDKSFPKVNRGLHQYLSHCWVREAFNGMSNVHNADNKRAWGLVDIGLTGITLRNFFQVLKFMEGLSFLCLWLWDHETGFKNRSRHIRWCNGLPRDAAAYLKQRPNGANRLDWGSLTYVYRIWRYNDEWLRCLKFPMMKYTNVSTKDSLLSRPAF